MNNLLYILMRRLRKPLITLIVVYSVSVLGFVLIPGVDDQGQPYRMNFFHAFYFVSFMGSTIGFGEIPYAFTDAQRLWTMFTIYATVISWLYGIGTTLALFQDPVFGRMMRRRRFAAQVRQLHQPFYLICGYGVTGSVVVRKLAGLGIQSVVIDIKESRIEALSMDDLPLPPPGLTADASLPDVLDDAGLQHKHCIGVLALTNRDNVNLAIAIASKLLVPQRMVISRTESDVTTANLDSFGTDLVVDPFCAYAEYLSLAAHAPYMHLVYDWLLNPYHRPLSSAYRRTRGRWIICGYGRFGKALCSEFAGADVELVVVDPDPPAQNGLSAQVHGIGTEAHTLREAGVEQAVGIVAGTGNDADNLSIIMTARELNPKLLTVVRQNLRANGLVFRNSRADFIMEPGRIIANRILAQIKTPLLPAFIEQLVDRYDDVWAHTLLNRMSSVVGDQELASWAYVVSHDGTPALCEALAEARKVTLALMLKNPRDRTRNLRAFPLLLRRGDEMKVLPGELHRLEEGDEILFCGLEEASRQMDWTVNNYNVLTYLLTGDDNSNNLLARWLNRSNKET
ncbi:potassium channel family protein [Marinobacterium arenosum]|uniref:potassium channel family protein n=1 Tax=Marinobacterium arenosum TaxID=2862496 RepID=UPI001C9870C0|nr:NAD-binding protein [Marinobacterium arenosum]MBY4677969.1 NAD-binding protein [Marinobacterium arenosum]